MNDQLNPDRYFDIDAWPEHPANMPEGEAKHLRMMGHPEYWPFYQFLPLTRTVTDRDSSLPVTEYGFLSRNEEPVLICDLYLDDEPIGDVIVYFGLMGHPTGEFRTYSDLAAAYADGWRVD